MLRNADLVPEAGHELRRHDRQGQGRRPRRTRSSSSRAPRATRTTCTRSRPRSAPRSSAPTPTAATTPTDLQLGNAGGEAFATWLGAQGDGTGVFNTDIDGDIAKEEFLDGTAAFWLTGPWNVGAAIDAGINVADRPVPSPTGGRPPSRSPASRASSSRSESKNKVAANDFLVNYIGTEDVQLALFEAGNVLPALTAAAETASSDPIIAGFAAVGAEAVPMPAIPADGLGVAVLGRRRGCDHQRRRPGRDLAEARRRRAGRDQ